MKSLKEICAFISAYIAAQVFRDIIDNYLELNSITKIIVLAAFAIPIYYLVLTLYNNKKIMKIIKTLLAAVTIIISAVTVIIPNNLYIYPIGLVLFGLLNLLSGLCSIKEGEKLTGRYLNIAAVVSFIAAILKIYIL